MNDNNLLGRGSETDQLSTLMRRELLRMSNQARTEAAFIRGGGGFAARRSERFYLKFLQLTFLVVFCVPSLMGCIYYFGYASNQYTTESYVSLSSQSSGVRAALSGLLGSDSTEQVSEMIEYIESPNFLLDVETKLDFSSLFSNYHIDRLSRLPEDAAIEDKLRYWRNRISIDRQSFTSQIRIRLRAFSPQDSLDLHRAVLTVAENHVNDTSRNNQNIRVKTASQSVERARTIYTDALEALRLTREKYGILDADATAQGYQTILATLRETAATLERRIETIKSQTESSPQLRRLTPQLEVVRDQISHYEQLIASPSSQAGNSVAAMAADLDAHQMNVDIARNEFATRMAVLESVQSETLGQTVFLQRSVEPTLPQRSTHPNRWLSFGLVFGTSFISWLLMAGLGLLIRDNMT